VVSSRAYINFKSPDSVLLFKESFDGHIFIGAKGNQYRCSVEYAPFQKTPAVADKKDVWDGTIEKGDEVELLHNELKRLLC
jgi:regulator of nonsense transcripts 3